ncbi:transcription initiation factor IIB family protein [Pyrobaculum calidifontis]|uniref:Zinc finger, TFIIB-type domain protein n=1 Tax=Pyrobaculum calidifontis (strain DSM 21063 / JCM 11548 / VA1) TaxID=410359 RepID=A3MT97_PYRCJ|nr:zinc finger TFIIB-type domain-containing protein [Pyrobaculum calidifontis]ABO07864.1 Zinc finger, TFIIB-type domain protein [Pyrobaculum calidifontis JCM 11548]
MACPVCGGRAVVVSPDGEYVCVQCGTVIGPVYMWPIRRVDERLAEKAAELSKGLRLALVKRGVPLREWLELEGARAWLEQKRRLTAWIPPSKRVEYYIEAAAAKLGLGRAALEEALALYRRLDRRALVGKSPRVVAAVIYTATCTPARAAAEALGVSPISVKATVRKLKLAVKICVRRGVPRGA